jgi:hypothetical protein
MFPRLIAHRRDTLPDSLPSDWRPRLMLPPRYDGDRNELRAVKDAERDLTDNWHPRGGFFLCRGLSGTGGVGLGCTTPPNGNYALEQRTFTCTASSLASSQSIVLHLSLNPEIYNGRAVVRDTATATSATPDPNTAKNMASFSASTIQRAIVERRVRVRRKGGLWPQLAVLVSEFS